MVNESPQSAHKGLVLSSELTSNDELLSLIGAPSARAYLNELNPKRQSILGRELKATTRIWLDGLRQLRTRARPKLESPDKWWLTDRGLQQSSGSRISKYKAHQLLQLDQASRRSWVDLCSGIGGDLIELARAAPTMSVERDPFLRQLQYWTVEEFGLLDRVRWSAVDLGNQSEASAAGDVAKPLIAEDWWRHATAWHLDPDRRVDDRRSSQPEFYSPDSVWIERLLKSGIPGCVKLAPAAQIKEWQSLGIREWIGDLGECKQQLLWVDGPNPRQGTRRVTLLDGIWGTRTLELEANDESGVSLPHQASSLDVGQLLFEPHAACLAAKAHQTFEHRWGIERLSEDGGYFCVNEDETTVSGEHSSNQSLAVWGALFRVWQIEKLDRKRLTQIFRKHDVGRVEWKKRDVPAQWLSDVQSIKLKGTRTVTALVFRLNTQVLIALADRCPVPERLA